MSGDFDSGRSNIIALHILLRITDIRSNSCFRFLEIIITNYGGGLTYTKFLFERHVSDSLGRVVEETLSTMEVDSSEDRFGIMLREAFEKLKFVPNKIPVISKENIEISVNKYLLLLFSQNFIRSVLSSVPHCITPTILLPDVSTTTILLIEQMLSKGVTENVKVTLNYTRFLAYDFILQLSGAN